MMGSLNWIDRRSAIWITVTVGALAAVGLIAFMLGSVGQDVASSEGDMVLAQEDVENEEALESEAATTTQVPVDVTYDVFLARDPFESIRPPEPISDDDPTGNGTGATNGSATNGQAGQPGTGSAAPGLSPGTGKDPSADQGACRTGTEAVCNGSVVVLTAVSDVSASLQVNGVAYVVAPGQGFAGDFQLLRITGDCVELLFMRGDEAEVFSLCLGGSVAK